MVRRSAQTLIAIGMVLAASLALGTANQAHAASTSTTKPKVGQCRVISYKRAAAVSDDRKPTSCSKRHNAVTFAVPTTTTPLARLTQDQLTAIGAHTCTEPFLKMLGRTSVRRAESAYTFVFFQPTTAQMQAGANWFRCDLVLDAGKKMLPLPTRLRHPVLPKRADDRTERCLTGTHLVTPCSTKHAYRPIDAIRFKPIAYPSRADFFQAAARLCPARTGYVTWVSADRWTDGDRVLVCYARTRK